MLDLKISNYFIKKDTHYFYKSLFPVQSVASGLPPFFKQGGFKFFDIIV